MNTWRVSDKAKTKDQKIVETLLKLSGYKIINKTEIKVYEKCECTTTEVKHKTQLDEYVVYNWAGHSQEIILLKPCQNHLKDYLSGGWKYL